MFNSQHQDATMPFPTQVPIATRHAPAAPRASANSFLANQRGATPIPHSLQVKMAAIASKNAQAPPSSSCIENALSKVSLSEEQPALPASHLSSRVSRGGGLAGRRLKPGLKLDVDDTFHVPQKTTASPGPLGGMRPGREPQKRKNPTFNTPFANFNKIVDPSGALNFSGKAILHASGVNFSSGASFAINMSQLRLGEELGRGHYGTVKKVLHEPTNVAMAMKEIRLELDEPNLKAILMELDILHRAVGPEIVDFYGAFFIESCVYYCMEYMDAGGLDKLIAVGVPEDVLARIAGSMVRGLKFLKDKLQIIHRDVKPTNVLVNKKGEIKLCDFGVSGQLEKSLAKTNIGCQSYMAPERIRGESQNNIGSYTVSSDVWSLGLSMIEIGMGKYPYPPETYSNVFAQLTAIVHGDPPELPAKYSDLAREWVSLCLAKLPERRATYRQLLDHPFLVEESRRSVDMVGWVQRALEYRAEREARAKLPFRPDSALPG